VTAADELTIVQGLVDELYARGQEERARALQTVLVFAASAIEGRPIPIDSREYLTTSRAAASLGVSRQTIKNWVRAGHLRGVVLGGRTLVHRAEVQAQLDRLLSAAPPESISAADPAEARAGYLAAVKAVPGGVLHRLESLHQRVEQGERLTSAERREIVTLERQVTRAATDAVTVRTRPKPASSKR
jgi:excisionase family DNA binding protein